MSVLEALTKPMTLDEFFNDYYAKRHVIFSPGKEYTQRILSWETLNDALIRASYVPIRDIILTKNGEDYFRRNTEDPEHAYSCASTGRLDTAQLYKEVLNGATLIFNQIYKFSSGCSDLASEIERLFLEAPSFNAYASVQPEPGLGMHWDNHDVFVIQSHGRKFWQLYEFTPENSLSSTRSMDIPEGIEPKWQGYLEEGQCLYVPRGMWHSVLSTGKPSLHTTCGFTGVLVSNLLYYIGTSEKRRSLWTDNFHPDYMSENELASLEAQIRDSVLSLLEPGFIKSFWANKKNAMPRTLGKNSLAFDWSNLRDDESARFVFLGAYEPHLEPSETGFVLSYNGCEIDIPNRFKRAFDRVARIGDAALQDLIELAELDDVSLEELISFMMVLNDHGVVGAVVNSE